MSQRELYAKTFPLVHVERGEDVLHLNPTLPDSKRFRKEGMFLEIPTICRYCGGVIPPVPAETVYGMSTNRLGRKGETLYQCQNCGARAGCHKGTNRPLGNAANEILQLKRIEANRVFDGLWQSRGMNRTTACKWLTAKMGLPRKSAHIGGFEMDQCQKVIDLCRNEEQKEAA